MKILINESQYQRIFNESGKMNYRPFDEAREFVRGLNLKSTDDWRRYCLSGEKPEDIPSNPRTVYPNEFKGVGDWLGTGNLGSIAKRRQFWPFEDAREYVRELKFKNYDEWMDYAKTDKRPIEIPAIPHQVYSEFKGYNDWIGKFMVVPYGKRKQKAKIISPQFLPFVKAREFVKGLNLTGMADWHKYSKSGNRPPNIPSNPHIVYGSQFKGFNDWLGTSYVPFEEARNYARGLKFNGAVAFKQWVKEKNNPVNFPGRPDVIYRGKGWSGWKDFLKGPVINMKTSVKEPRTLSDDVRIQRLQDRISALEDILKQSGLLQEQRIILEDKLDIMKNYHNFLHNL
jgi:hypothetical protein